MITIVLVALLASAAAANKGGTKRVRPPVGTGAYPAVHGAGGECRCCATVAVVHTHHAPAKGAPRS